MKSRDIETAPRYSSLIGELMMQAPVPVCVLLGQELRIDFANPPFEALLGRALPRAVPLREVFPEFAADAPTLQLFARVFAGEPFAADEQPLPLPMADGSAQDRWFNLSCQPMRRADDTVFGIMIVAIDVSQSVRLREAEIASTNALRRTETRLRAAIEAADVGTFFLDIEADRLTADGLLAQLFGIDAALASGGIPLQRFVDAIEPEDRERVLSLLRSTLREGAEYSDEHRVRDAQGEVRWVSTKGRVERDADGKPAYFLGALADVSDTRRATDALQNATRVKDEFLAMLGHELRNPLAPIVTALHLLRLRPHVGLEREIGIIERQVAHLLRLVDDLLDVSRITRGKIELRREAVDVSRIVAQAVEVATPLLQLKRQKLNLHSGGAAQLLVDADPSRLTQALTNLLTNASRYSPEDSQIAVVTERRGDRIFIRVRDWGQGIGPDLLPEVFELFSQGPQAIDRSQGGLGLGLAIVKNLVEMHGGTVTASSAGVGKGSEFTICLPLSMTAAPGDDARPAANAGAAVEHSVRRILIVDDNQDAADMLGLVLGDFGHQVRVAYDAHEGLKVAAEFRPQCALLDIGLPTMSGYELAGQMRNIPELQCTLYAVTGYGQTGDRERALAAGFARHFVKPTSIEELQAAIVAS